MANALELRHLTKHYGAVKALNDFSHSFAKGQVHALLGKNGSGKSTFIKMLAGAVQPTTGEILVDGRPCSFAHPSDALKAGIVTVYQELSLVPHLSVAENIYLGRLPRHANTPFIDWPGLLRQAKTLLHEMGAGDIDPAQPVSCLSIGRQQLVEIVKAMSLNPSVLQLDEPTSALAQAEVQQLFGLVRRLRDRGVTIIYISHRLAELSEIADTVTALRDGHFTGSCPMADATPAVILEMMFGDITPVSRPPRPIAAGEPILSVRDLKIEPMVQSVSFDLHRGEVLGIAGMLGSGRTELLRAIYGAGPIAGGEIRVDGKRVETVSIPTMKRLGIGYTSEDRKESGLVQILSIHANLCLAAMQRFSHRGFVTQQRERPAVERQIKDLSIKIGSPMLPVSSLSGGNQQKVVVGNWLNNAPRVLLFDEPGRGVDVQAKQQIYQIIWSKALEGLSSIVVSTELEDLVECCDRILILRDGHITEEFVNDGLDPKTLYAACMARQITP
ncbi:sugar-transporting ATPase [Rhizobium sp. Root274]|uniref:sugar ABC transporter ATP-binding protein n=1 Tax=unclassified Rhizobium TaxID=2613769 RepID=UPI0007162279|nr:MULTISPECIES: sugar ABC transporter ATP-binding protein [unclassified Rhizobium]KQW27233.1 sugar-transporting ATPase [Rhizobium sp. Root1240]KRD26710.1 sugar-transporting ATPase [Rhizobium sp. Root274]